MSDNRAIEILKKALLLEKESQSFYSKEAELAEHESVRNIFNLMAEEEKNHENVLLSEYNQYLKDGNFFHNDDLGEHSEFYDHVLSDDVKDEIRQASHEAEAISAGIGLERRTIELYADRAEATDDPMERELFVKLKNQEKDHLKYLSDLHRRILESRFFDGVE
ncbi:MAG TPA: hypothetical protein ENN41_09570 [Sediminispirochaeta sp.]|nr:hypothetical protein [Sediminispirochaeta sp.]